MWGDERQHARGRTSQGGRGENKGRGGEGRMGVVLPVCCEGVRGDGRRNLPGKGGAQDSGL